MKLLQDITLGQYFPGESCIHHLDPRTKTVSLIILIVTIFSAGGVKPLFLIALFIMLCARIASFSILFVLRGISLFFWIFAFTAIFHLFFTPGDSVYPFPVWGVNLTRQGLDKGFVVFSQLFLVIFLSYVFMLTTSPREMTLGLEKMLRPFRFLGVKTEEVALMASLAVRFIPVLREEAIKIVNAQRSRGVSFGQGPIVKRAGNIVSVIGPLFTNIFRRTDSLALAMISRGFGEVAERGSLVGLGFGKGDVFAILITFLFSLLIVLRY